MICIFSTKKAAALGLDKKSTAHVEIKAPALSKHKPETGDQTYLDISGLSAAELKKALNQLKKRCAGAFWGIIDPKGAAPDPAAFFFAGASDYIGPGAVKKGINLKRLAAALAYSQAGGKAVQGDAENKAGPARKTQKLPPGKFEGWKSIRIGTSASFFFLFISLSGKSNLRSVLGEAAFSVIRNRLRDVLQQALREAEALLWMETEMNCLFLVPPGAANGKAAIEAALKLILNSRIMGIEKLGISVPVELTCALHYGKTVFHEPGKTGTVVSDAVNYIFHLGTKQAEKSRLTISGDVPAEIRSEDLADLFSSAGIYEDIPIDHSRKFTYS
jgi:translation initiation factor 1 (eIF-1/SUI1)